MFDASNQVQVESTGPLSCYNTIIDEWSALGVNDWSNLLADGSTPVFSSVYDATGNATTITDPSGTSTFTYDATNRIETIVGPSGITTFTYDDSGQLLTRQAPLGATTTYTWDGDGRLIKAELPGSAVFTLIYDGQGMLGSKQSASGTTQYLWHGKVLQAQTDGTGNPIKVYTQGQGATAAGKEHGDISASYDVAGDTTSYPLTDAQGTAIGIVDDSGSVTRTNVFDAFGKQTDSTGSGDESLKYVASKGYLWHDDLGLYYVRQRWFDPSFQKWLSNDPLVFGGGDYNLNRYVMNRAMDREDPSGEFPLLALLVVALLAAAAAALIDAARQGVRYLETREQWSWSEFFKAIGTGFVAGPLTVLAPEFMIPLMVGMGLISAGNEYSQGHWATGSFDLATSLLPFAFKGSRAAVFDTVLGEKSFWAPKPEIITRAEMVRITIGQRVYGLQLTEISALNRSGLLLVPPLLPDEFSTLDPGYRLRVNSYLRGDWPNYMQLDASAQFSQRGRYAGRPLPEVVEMLKSEVNSRRYSPANHPVLAIIDAPGRVMAWDSRTITALRMSGLNPNEIGWKNLSKYFGDDETEAELQLRFSKPENIPANVSWARKLLGPVKSLREIGGSPYIRIRGQTSRSGIYPPRPDTPGFGQ